MSDQSGVSSANLELLLELNSGATYTDSSGNARDQTPVLGAAEYVSDGAISQAAVFSYSKRNEINVGATSIGSATLFCEAGAPFTVATFIRFAGASTFGAGTICARQSGTGDVGKATSNFFLHVTESRQLLCRLRGADNLYDVSLHDAAWHLIVFTWSGTAAKLYVDNVELDAPSVGNAAANTAPIYIAGSHLPDVSVPSSNLVGQLDDWRCYSRALSAAEVNLLWVYGRPDQAGGGDIQLEDLELRLDFDGDDLTDTSIHGRDQDANLVNGPLAFPSGRVGVKAATFDANEPQYIATGVEAFGDCTLFSDASNEFTVTGWVAKKSGAGGIGMVVSRAMSTQGFRLQVTNGGANVTLRGQLNNYTLTGNDDGEWHHYAVTWNGTTPAFYHDGAAQAVPNNGTDTEGSEDIYIGTLFLLGSPTLSFDGHLDDLRFYSRALSADDVLELFTDSSLNKFDVTIETQSIDSNGVVTIAVDFEKSVSTFVAGDVSITGGTVGTPVGSGTAWTFTVTPTGSEVTVSIAEDAVTADDDTLNRASNTLIWSSPADPEAGGLLQFSRTATPGFEGSAIIGPIQIAPNMCLRSVLQEIRYVFGSGTIADNGSQVHVSVGISGEDAIQRAINGGSQFSTSISSILANSGQTYPRLGGSAMALEIAVAEGDTIVFEQACAGLKEGGRNRGARFTP